MEAGSDDGARVSVGADTVRDHVEHVIPVEVRRGPDVGVDAHGRAVAASVCPTGEGVGVPQGGWLSEVPRGGFGGPAAAKRVREPDRQFDAAECLHVEASAADRPAHGHAQLGVVGPAPGGKRHIDAPPAADSPLPSHQVVQGRALRPPFESLAVHEFADEAEGVPVGRPKHRSSCPRRARSSLVSSTAHGAVPGDHLR